MSVIKYSYSDTKPPSYYINSRKNWFLLSSFLYLFSNGSLLYLNKIGIPFILHPFIVKTKTILIYTNKVGITLLILTTITTTLIFLFGKNPYNRGRIYIRLKQNYLANKIQKSMIDTKLFNPRYGREGFEVGAVYPSLTKPMFIEIEIVGATADILQKSENLLNASLKGVFKNLVISHTSSDRTGRWFRIYLIDSSKNNQYIPNDISDFISKKNYQFKLDNGTTWDISKSPHALIAGKTGSGKTYALYGLILQMLILKSEIFIIDPKNSELNLLSEILSTNNVSSEVNTTLEIIDNLLTVLDERQKLIKSLVKKNNLFDVDFTHFPQINPIFLLIDEVGALQSSFSDNKIAKKFNADLKQLILKGRSVGINIILITQQPNAQNIPTEIRDQLGLRLLLGNSSVQSRQMTFGEGYNYPEMEFNQGEGLFLLDGVVNSPTRIKTINLSHLGNNLLPIFKMAQQVKNAPK